MSNPNNQMEIRDILMKLHNLTTQVLDETGYSDQERINLIRQIGVRYDRILDMSQSIILVKKDEVV